MKQTRPLKSSDLSLLIVFVLTSFISSSFGQDESGNVVETYREAYDFGYQDGANVGIEERKQNQPSRLGWHTENLYQKDEKESLRGFDPRAHDKEIFLVAYKRGFEDGYKQGYNFTSEKIPSPSSRPTSPGKAKRRHRETRPVTNNWANLNIKTIQTLPTGTDLHIELMDRLGTRFNQRGDSFRARVAREVVFLGQSLIPKGTRITGRISHLKKAGRVRGRAQIGLRCGELKFLDGRIIPFEATIVALQGPQDFNVKPDEGTIEASGTKKKDLGTVAKTSTLGTLIGLVTGGKKGSARGALGGAVGGLGQVLLTRGKDVKIEPRSQIQIRLTEDLELIP